jgi:hypothetical protein
MEQSDSFPRIAHSLRKREPKRAAEAECALVDRWLDEQQWLAGFPAGATETVIWGWWHSQ